MCDVEMHMCVGFESKDHVLCCGPGRTLSGLGLVPKAWPMHCHFAITVNGVVGGGRSIERE